MLVSSYIDEGDSKRYFLREFDYIEICQQVGNDLYYLSGINFADAAGGVKIAFGPKYKTLTEANNAIIFLKNYYRDTGVGELT